MCTGHWLGIKPKSSVEEIRASYTAKAARCPLHSRSLGLTLAVKNSFVCGFVHSKVLYLSVRRSRSTQCASALTQRGEKAARVCVGYKKSSLTSSPGKKHRAQKTLAPFLVGVPAWARLFCAAKLPGALLELR